MPSRATPRTSTRRRSLIALLVTLLVAATGGTALMVGSATQDVRVDDPFVVPMPHVGDHGTYRTRVIETTDLGVVSSSDETFTYAFRWNETGAAYDPDGRHHWTNRLDLHDARDPMDPRTLHFDQATGALVALEQHRHERRANDMTGTAPGYEKESRFILFTPHATPAPMPCGLRHALQGASSAPHGGILFPACMLPSAPYDLGQTEFTFLGGREHDGHRYAWYRATGNQTGDASPLDAVHGQPDITVTFRDDIPYPVLFEIGPDAHGALHQMRLATHGRGAAPLADTASTEPPLPTAELVPRPAWLLDDAGVGHPYPLSRAFADARADPRTGLDAYLDAHPDAVMVQASYSEERDGTTTQHAWDFRMSDGKEAIWTHHRAGHVADTTPVLPLGLLDAGGARVTDDAPVPPLPDRLPTVASLFHIGAHVAATLGTDTTFNGWSFHASPDGPAGALWIEVGETRQTTSTAHPAGAVLGSDLTQHHEAFAFDAEGRLIGMTLHRYGPVQPNDEGAGPGTLGPLASRIEPVAPWALPAPAQAAGIGLVAVLAGLLYWAAPAIKGALGGAFFSRVDRPRVLEHAERARVAAVIEADPGLHASLIVQRSGLSRGAVRHHLAKLVATGHVQAVRSTRYTCYHPAAADRRIAAAAPILRAESAQRILAHLAARPGSTVSETAAALGISKQAVARQAARLEQAELLHRRSDGRHVRLVLSATGTLAQAARQGHETAPA